MLSVQGIYDGRQIQLPPDINVMPNIRVIITFLDDKPEVSHDDDFEYQTELIEKNGLLVAKGETSDHPANFTRHERDCRVCELLQRVGL
jgi:hypothetical protein